MPGGVSRDDAIRRAQEEIDRAKPEIANYLKLESERLDVALQATCEHDHYNASSMAEVYAASQNVRDIAASVGHSLLGFIAANLCEIFETAETARINYPIDVIRCHFDALRLARSGLYEDRTAEELPELVAGLRRTITLVKGIAARATAANASEPPKGKRKDKRAD